MAVESTSGVLPWLRWAGGKRTLAPSLVPEILATQPTLYIEPFLGGGAVALALPAELPKVLADVNPHLIDCWLCVQKIPGTLFDELHAVEKLYGDGPAGYIKARDEFNKAVRNARKMWARRSALFMYLNARCFNGLWRTNASGFFNVPYGKLEKPRRFELADLEAYAVVLRSETIVDGHYAKVVGIEFSRRTNAARGRFVDMQSMMKGTAIYADSPYAGTFDGYTKDGFDEQDQRVLAGQLASHAAAGAAVWASNSDTELIRELYGWAQIETVNEQHSVGSKPERRGKRGCVLIRGGAAVR